MDKFSGGKAHFKDVGVVATPRTEAKEKRKGGRGARAEGSWEEGADKGDAYQLFSRCNLKGEALDDFYCCVLCARFLAKETLIKKGINGQSNLWDHLESTHGIARVKDLDGHACLCWCKACVELN